MVSPLRGAWRLTHRSYCEIPVTVKPCVPPQQSWGVSHICLGTYVTDSWIHESYGRKIEKAMRYRDEGVPLSITLSLQTLGHIGFARQRSLGLRGNALGPFVRLDLRTC